MQRQVISAKHVQKRSVPLKRSLSHVHCAEKDTVPEIVQIHADVVVTKNAATAARQVTSLENAQARRLVLATTAGQQSIWPKSVISPRIWPT